MFHAIFGIYLYQKIICCLSNIQGKWTSCMLSGNPPYQTFNGQAPVYVHNSSHILVLFTCPSNLSLQDFKPFQLLSLCINVSLCLDCSTFSSLCSFLLFIVQVSAQMPLLRKFFLYIQRGPLSLLPQSTLSYHIVSFYS